MTFTFRNAFALGWRNFKAHYRALLPVSAMFTAAYLAVGLPLLAFSVLFGELGFLAILFIILIIFYLPFIATRLWFAPVLCVDPRRRHCRRRICPRHGRERS